MVATSNEEVVRAYARAIVEGDRDVRDGLRHPAWSAEWPQSGEVVRGSAKFRAIEDAYPGGTPETRTVDRIVGIEDHWELTPAATVIRIAGDGESWWAEFGMRYPDGKDYLAVTLLQLRDGRVVHEVVYWAEPFDAPGWRAAWTERRQVPG